MTQEQFLRTSDARALLNVSRATFDRMRKRPGFLKPVILGPRCYRWRESELLAFAKASQGAKAA